MNISPKEWDERWEKIFGKKQEQKDIKLPKKYPTHAKLGEIIVTERKDIKDVIPECFNPACGRQAGMRALRHKSLRSILWTLSSAAHRPCCHFPPLARIMDKFEHPVRSLHVQIHA